MSTLINPYKRMILLPENEYTLLKQCRLPVSNELIWPTADSVEREQKLYALKLRAQREMDNPESADQPSTPTLKTSLTAEVNHFPKTIQSRAKRLLAFLEEHRPFIQWNREGEVTFGPHGSPHSGSKLSDLIYHATAILERSFQPIAWPEFLNALREMNAPSTALSNATLKEMHRGLPATAKAEESMDDTSSLRRKKRRRRTQVLATQKQRHSWLEY